MRPRRIIIMRHAESREDVDKSVYAHTADLDIALSPHGEEQAREAVEQLIQRLDSSHVHFYISPGLRLKQTYDLMMEGMPEYCLSFSVEQLMLKQFWGDVTVENRREIEIARYREGVLAYRFPNGESGPELLGRFACFIETLQGSFSQEEFPENIVILTHGFEMRVFLMVWFGLTVQEFERLANPRNCEMVSLTLQADGTYRLEDTLRLYDASANALHVGRA